MRNLAFFQLFILAILSFYVDAGEWRLAICYGKSATANDLSYRQAISISAARTFSLIDAEAETVVQIRECPQEPELACYADTSAIYCREEYLSQLVRIAAWVAAERVITLGPEAIKPAALNQNVSLDWTDAYLLADATRFKDDKRLRQVKNEIYGKGHLNEMQLTSINNLYLDIHKHVRDKSEPDTNNPNLMLATQLYEGALDYAFAFLLGHEAFHFNNNRCYIEADSIVRTRGIWDVIRALQQAKGLFDPSNKLDVIELKADECGIKWLQALSVQRKLNGNPILNTLIRKAAIELLASPMLIGLGGSLHENRNGVLVPIFKVVPGYLYPQSRLTLITSTLRLTDNNYPEVVKMCGAVSKAMVSLIQTSFKAYPESSGIIPDELLAELPPGVEKSWNGETWTDASYLCKTGGI